MNAVTSRILIILMGSVGDVARGLVVVDKLKRIYPKGQIAWLVEPTCAPIVTLHGQIDQVIVFERKRGLRALPQLRRQLRAFKADITLDLQRHFKSGFFSWLSAARRRIGFHSSDSKEFNWLFNNETIAAFANDQPKLLHYLKFVEHLGGDTSEPYSFGIASQQHLSAVGQSSDLVGIVLGSRWKSKDWMMQGYQRLIIKLLEQTEFKLVLLGDRSQVTLAATLEQACRSPRVSNLCAQTSLLELIRIIESCRVCIGPDSGPGHLAAAVATPYVSLFGPTDPRRVAPYRGEDLAVRAAVGCSPCNRKVCPGLNNLCMRLISVEDVYSAVQRAAY